MAPAFSTTVKHGHEPKEITRIHYASHISIWKTADVPSHIACHPIRGASHSESRADGAKRSKKLDGGSPRARNEEQGLGLRQFFAVTQHDHHREDRPHEHCRDRREFEQAALELLDGAEVTGLPNIWTNKFVQLW